jgi:hypothetical protein
MGCISNLKENKNEHEFRKLYINLLSDCTIQQPENFCDNKIKTTRFTM